MDIVGEKIKMLRNNAGLSQADLAKIVGVKNRSSIANYEAGRLSPDYSVLVAIANYFKVTTDYLLGVSDEPTAKAKVSFELEDGRVLTDLGQMISEIEPSDQKMLIDLIQTLKEKAEANKKLKGMS